MPRGIGPGVGQGFAEVSSLAVALCATLLGALGAIVGAGQGTASAVGLCELERPGALLHLDTRGATVRRCCSDNIA